MPLYEYRCKQCGHRFEKIQSFSAPEEKVCPVCKGEVERLISAPAVQFKGSGFYSTDYGSKPAPRSPESGSKEGSEARPAAPAESGDGAAPKATPAPSTPAKTTSSKE